VLELTSKEIDPWYVLGFLNSEMVEVLLTGVKRSAIANRRQPDDLRQIVVPLLDSKTMKQVATLAKNATDAQKKLFGFRAAGWSIEALAIKAPGDIPSEAKSKSLSVARASWGLTVHKDEARLSDLYRVDHDILSLFTVLGLLKIGIGVSMPLESSPTGYRLQNGLDKFGISVRFRLNGVAEDSESGCRNSEVKGQDTCPAATVARNLGRERTTAEGKRTTAAAREGTGTRTPTITARERATQARH